MKFFLFLALSSAASLAFAGGAAAEGPEGDGDEADAAAQAAEDAALEEARKVFREGNAHYAAGRYDLAAERFLRAYQLSARPELLFNLANTYERKGQYEKAAEYLRLYLASDKVHDLVSVRERLKRLELAIVRQREEERESAAEPAAGGGAITAAVAPPPRDQPSRVPYAVAGGGVVAGVAVAATFALLADGERREIDSMCTGGSSGLICSPEAAAHLDRERRFALASDIGTGVAALSAAGALVYFIATRGKESPATAAPVAFGDGGFGLAATARF
jgi:tetratricopeptide (TPR) repeat protein